MGTEENFIPHAFTEFGLLQPILNGSLYFSKLQRNISCGQSFFKLSQHTQCSRIELIDS